MDSEGAKGTQRRRTRCGKCDPCTRTECGECSQCVKKTKFGGDGTNKGCCVKRRCIYLHKQKDAVEFTESTNCDNESLKISVTTCVPNQISNEPRLSEKKTRIKIKVKNETEMEPTLLSRKMITERMARSPKHLYGKEIPMERKGECAGCLGERNIPAKGEPVLLCDGEGCSREYHLKCAEPPLTQIPDGEFFCPDCDFYGNTAQLRAYFENVDDARAEFPSSREFVEALLHCQIASELEDQDENESNCTEPGADSEGSEVSRKRKRNDDDIIENQEFINVNNSVKMKKDFPSEVLSKIKKLLPSGSEMGETDSEEVENFPDSEIGKISQLHNAAIQDGKWLNKDKRPNEASRPASSIGPDFLVGKTLRLYCPTDNAYHVGRIVDWRAATCLSTFEPHNKKTLPLISREGAVGMGLKIPFTEDIQHLFFGKGKIGVSEFLVRFPSGFNGRKQTLHQWIILEEHSAAVSTTLIFGHRDKGRGLNGWKPAQLLLRSSLELLPVRGLLPSKGNWGLAAFFGEESHVFLNLDDESVSLFSEAFHQHRDKKLSAQHNQSNHLLDLATKIACLENDERLRGFKWHTLPLNSVVHSKSLTTVDEFALDSLAIGRDFAASTISDDISMSYEMQDLSSVQPKLSPLIQHGLDRFWISNLVSSRNMEMSMDTFASFTCVNSSSTPFAMAQLKKN